MKKVYKVALNAQEEAELQALISKGKTSARKVTRARILLLAHAGEKDAAIARALQTSVSTVERTRKNLVLEGLKPALEEAPRPGAKPKLDAQGHGFLVALACSTPPLGREGWTLELLSDRLVALGYVGSFSKESVRRALKKNDLQPWRHKQWAIPTPGAEFVWRMEEVISLYTEDGEPDPARPYVCFDETSKQLVAETRQPPPPKPGKPARFDYEYERKGTANVFMLVAPRLDWRQVNVTERRTRVDFALQMRLLVDDYFPQAATIRVVLDNLNTHNPASLYEAFPPEEAKRILDRLEFHHTPKHGSWLNMAEIELSLLSRQCLKPRVPDADTLRAQIDAWQAVRNADHARIHWAFRLEDARRKLTRLYPAPSA